MKCNALSNVTLQVRCATCVSMAIITWQLSILLAVHCVTVTLWVHWTRTVTLPQASATVSCMWLASSVAHVHPATGTLPRDVQCVHVTHSVPWQARCVTLWVGNASVSLTQLGALALSVQMATTTLALMSTWDAPAAVAMLPALMTSWVTVTRQRVPVCVKRMLSDARVTHVRLLSIT